MLDDWMIAVLGLFGFFSAILIYIVKTWKDIARLEGRIDSLQKDIGLLRGENESMRIRTKGLEQKAKELESDDIS